MLHYPVPWQSHISVAKSTTTEKHANNRLLPLILLVPWNCNTQLLSWSKLGPALTPIWCRQFWVWIWREMVRNGQTTQGGLQSLLDQGVQTPELSEPNREDPSNLAGSSTDSLQECTERRFLKCGSFSLRTRKNNVSEASTKSHPRRSSKEIWSITGSLAKCWIFHRQSDNGKT